MRVSTGGRISGKTHLRPYNTTFKRDRRDMVPYYAGAVRSKRARSSAMQPYKRVPNQPRARYSKTRKMTYNVPKSGAGSTFSKVTFGSKRPPRAFLDLYKINQEYTYEDISSTRQTSAFGKQAVYLSTLLDFSEINLLWGTIPNIPTSTLWQTGKFILQNMSSKLTFTNQDLATCYVSIYSIIPRFHIPSGNNPIALWDKGLEDQTLVPATNTQYLDAYSKPFASQQFCLFYKVDKVTTFELQQGQSHCHESYYNLHKEVHGQISNTFSVQRDISKMNMMVISGTPINDLTTKSLVSTSSCAVDIVEHVTINYTYAAAQRRIRTYTNTLGTITTAELASIGAGLVVTEDEA